VTVREGLLVLADGTTFEGELIGAEPAGAVASGEVVFNTVLSGYQEVLSDPSYAGQIITFTYPHIGNYGVNADDDESRRPFARGVVVRDLARRRSNWRSTDDLEGYLRRHGVPGIAGVDTRRLTRHIREAGAMPGAFGAGDEVALKAAAVAEPGTDGVDLVATVTCAEPYTVAAQRGGGDRRILAYDFGIKRTILRHLSWLGEVTVVPASTPADEALARGPDGVFLSNGPGDPAAVAGATEVIAGLVDRVPVFGICLGHQLLATALGATTHKLPFGHHGGNHPVRRLQSGRVEITSQNHNYAVAEGSLGPDVTVTHINLNDGVIEGIRAEALRAFSVQYHPEAGPGPHDAAYLFDEFADLIDASGRGTR
jgi:carbamoyl-phosphate synthase small subunit